MVQSGSSGSVRLANHPVLRFIETGKPSARDPVSAVHVRSRGRTYLLLQCAAMPTQLLADVRGDLGALSSLWINIDVSGFALGA